VTGADPAATTAIDAVVDEINGDPMALHELLEQQSYRLAWWRMAASELDYRRFFDITELVALNVEHPHVFDAVHELPVRWVARGLVDGLRVDHLDGLRDPEAYMSRLTEAAPGGGRPGRYPAGPRRPPRRRREPRHPAARAGVRDVAPPP
jgi:(1->4)-alpha-D-glucan 1-alpha-D-glucosylmutase